MLTLATNAIPVIRQATRRSGSPDEAGLRIEPTTDGRSLGVHAAAEPVPGDQIITAGGARVFVAADAIPHVEDLELYAVIESGEVHLALRPPITMSEN